MRLSTVVCLGLILVGITSGCAMMHNPLASKTDPQAAARRRMIAEMNARTEKGDIAGARQILARIEASERVGQTDSSVIPLGQPRASSDPADVSKLVDRLVALDPPALRESSRQEYANFSPAQLKQMLAEYEQTAAFGQQNLNQFVPAAASSEIMYASNSNQPPGPPRPSVPNTGRAGQLAAPDPRSAGGLSLGTQSPWSVDQRGSQPAGVQAPRLPDSNIPNVAQNGGFGTGGGLQTVSGELPARSGIAGSAPGPATTNPFPGPGQQNTQPTSELPIISPGNSGFQNPIQPPSAKAPATGTGTASFLNNGNLGVRNPGSGGVSLMNEISEIDQAPKSSAFNPGFNTGAFPGASPLDPTGTAGPQFPDNTNQQVPQPGDSVPSQTRRPNVLETGVQGVQQIIKDAAGRTFRNFGQGEPAENPAKLAMNNGQAEIPNLIHNLNTELLRATPGQTDAERVQYIRKHVNLRMLHLVAGDVSQAVEPIPGIAPADQEFWQQMIWSVSNYFDDQGMPDASDRSAETIEQLRGAIAQLGQTAHLKLRNTTFCHRIVSFGNYDRFKEDRFTTGQPVLLYSEVENFTSRSSSSNAGYRTELRSAIEIYRANDLQQPAATVPLPVDSTEDFCRAQRRDYFHSYEFSIPANLEPGQYTLVLRIVDQQSRKVATSRVNFEVE
ncbi:MAG: hypothetical protein ACKVHE_05820 [Planctomycetales bacterium]